MIDMAKKKTADQPAEANGRKPKQGYLADMEPPHIDEIDAAAENYVQARDLRMSYLKQEIERGDLLLQLMAKHKLKSYEYEGKTVLVAEGPVKVKVKRKAEQEGEDE